MKRLLFAFMIFTLLLAGCATASPTTEQPVTPTEGQPAPAVPRAASETTEAAPRSGLARQHRACPRRVRRPWRTSSSRPRARRELRARAFPRLRTCLPPGCLPCGVYLCAARMLPGAPTQEGPSGKGYALDLIGVSRPRSPGLPWSFHRSFGAPSPSRAEPTSVRRSARYPDSSRGDRQGWNFDSRTWSSPAA